MKMAYVLLAPNIKGVNAPLPYYKYEYTEIFPILPSSWSMQIMNVQVAKKIFKMSATQCFSEDIS